MIEKIREIAKNWLAEGKVDVVIGFGEGTTPFSAKPIFITKPDDVEKLIWNPLCRLNLAGYVRREILAGRKVGVVAKGCDSRSIGILLAEKQFDRKDVSIIGVPCQGMVDRKTLMKKFGNVDGEKVSADWNSISVGDKSISTEEVLSNACRICRYPTPVHYDELVGEKIEGVSIEEHDKPAVEMLEKNREDRWKFYTEHFGRCIRCYACRQACPTCYCDECFVDSNDPKWLEKGQHPTDLMLWNLGRIYHQVGRCVECGSCESVCPMDIPFTEILAGMSKRVRELYDYESGIAVDEPPPLQTFKTDDPQEFIM
ncbi:4Fe-4S dicluster domain-containing protein [bacterium]|nr:4Fe-4S dicluster domain-containing protein [bacterium]